MAKAPNKSSQQLKTSNLGFPRIGAQRELKKALEEYWLKKINVDQLQSTASDLRRRHWMIQKVNGIAYIPSNDFSLYDQMLDMIVMLGAIPERYQSIKDDCDLTRYFAMARGLQDPKNNHDVQAMTMTKWFDTNYHYIVPELSLDQAFALNSTKILNEIKEARSMGVETRPVVIGPMTFLLLSKFPSNVKDNSASTLGFLDKVLAVYQELFAQLHKEGVEWVQVDEPCLVLELDDSKLKAYAHALATIKSWKQRPRVQLSTYFDVIGANLKVAVDASLDALHLDLVRGPNQLDQVLSSLPSEMILSAGVVDGRNIWRSDLDAAHRLIRQAVKALGPNRVWVAPSCSLLHVPVDLENEKNLDEEIKTWLSFATQKLAELNALAMCGGQDEPDAAVFQENRNAINSRKSSKRIHHDAVKSRLQGVSADMLSRHSKFPVRQAKHRDVFKLRPFPTTTIGSFPQTAKVRKARADWRSGKITQAEYDQFMMEETRDCINKQLDLDIDVLVHGEFERTDMVEYFGEQLSGFAFTSNGWVQSYGSRCVKPPVIFGDVSRPTPMTVKWSTFAQSLTSRPMKGMLTGPVTILQWSFVRNDQPRSTTCKQIALALRDEVMDLESAGIKMIQVDEAAIREGLPLRRADWEAYLKWAVDSFRLATSGVSDKTQIHTHMCYSEFSDILDAVAAMDADVLSIETSRSRMELLKDFEKFKYPNEIGPGVYDIHSPRVPSVDEIVDLLERAAKVIPIERLWVNPDCGLKTRGWPEVDTALLHMTQAAEMIRKRFEKKVDASTSPSKKLAN